MNAVIQQTKAEGLRMFRNPYYLFWSLLMPIVFYYLFTNIFNTDITGKEEWQGHYLMSMASFSVMGSSIMTLGIRLVQERNQGWSMYIRTVPLPGWIFFFAKMAGQTAVHFFSILLIFTAGVLLNGVSFSAAVWASAGLWILLASFPFLALGTLIGTMRRVDTATGVSNFLYLGLAITGGMWMPLEMLPQILQGIGKWLPGYHYGSGAWSIIRGNSPNLENILILAAYLLVFMILSVYIRRKQEAV